MSADKIEVERTDKGFVVRRGELYDHGLCPDEALFCVAQFLVSPEQASRYLKTQEQHDAWNAKYGHPAKEVE